MRAVFIAGTTGEFSSLTLEERKSLCETWVEAGRDDLRIVAHTGHNCLAEAVELTAHARQAGAAAIAAIAPSYFRPASIQDLIEFCLPIAAEADPLPFYFYHIPGMTNVRLPIAEFLHEARFRMPNLRGLKFSHSDLVELQDCVNVDDGAFEVVFGQDEFLLAGLCFGVRGAVGATYNFAGPHYQRLIHAFESGDLKAARAAQLQASRMIQVLNEFGFLAATKVAMSLIGVDCGPVRSPLHSLSPERANALAQKLSRFELFASPMTPVR
jgi:N-acetylneuraminate lyase